MIKKALFLILFCGSHFLSAQVESKVVGPMPNGVYETSGLIFYNGKLITHNDSGNAPQLFEIDTTSLQITRTVTISNVQNIDWEDISQDSLYIYIADIGNNLGARQDLAIYRIPKSTYDQSDSVSAELINFAYEDQTDFSDSGNSDWDAEALINMGDQLIILTKQWKTNGTDAYSLPKIPGTYTATRLDGFDTQGLVTAATYNPLTKILYILGYSTVLDPFFYRVEGVTQNTIFGGKVEKISPNVGYAQAEGLTYVSEQRYFFSSEYFALESPPITIASTLFTFNTSDSAGSPSDPDPDPDPEPEPEPVPEPGVGRSMLQLFRPQGSAILGYQLTPDKSVVGQAIFDTTGRRVSFITSPDLVNDAIDISTLGTAVYYLTLYLNDEVLSKPFAKN